MDRTGAITMTACWPQLPSKQQVCLGLLGSSGMNVCYLHVKFQHPPFMLVIPCLPVCNSAQMSQFTDALVHLLLVTKCTSTYVEGSQHSSGTHTYAGCSAISMLYYRLYAIVHAIDA